MFGLSDKESIKIIEEATKRSSFTQWFKMRYWELDPVNEKDLDELASEIYNYFNL